MVYTDCPRCGDELTVNWRVVADSDGDAGVIGGLRSWQGAEYEGTDCGCDLTDAEIAAAQTAADRKAATWYPEPDVDW